MIITFANHKGGVGKTTLALITAETLLKNNVGVVMYDLDPQRNLTYFVKQLNEGICTQQKLPEKLINSANYYTIIDTAPGLGEAAETAIKNADVIVVPVDTSTVAIQGYVDIVKMQPSGRIVLVLNRYDKKSAYSAAVIEELKAIIKDNKRVSMVFMPNTTQLATNANTGKFWGYRMSDKTANPIIEIVKKIVG